MSWMKRLTLADWVHAIIGTGGLYLLASLAIEPVSVIRISKSMPKSRIVEIAEETIASALPVG